MIQKISLGFLILFFTNITNAQYWQQSADYTMSIDMDVNTNRFEGKQKLIYTNNSPDTLSRVFYHLYFNAFQPGSMMDVRSRSIVDPDPRVKDRISKLKDDEIGYQKVDVLKQDGKKLEYTIDGTILEVKLHQPILPGQKTTFDMEFTAQVPLQIRRSGRDNKEGIRYSMTQWYPKMVEYDYRGWNANPYVGREFHGVWGNFDVTIHIDSDYILGATGNLQEANKIGYGYGNDVVIDDRPAKLSWRFLAKNVHDFAWVADPDFTHTKTELKNGTVLHFLYQKDSTTTNWDSLPKYAVQIFEEMNRTFGEYPYKQYTVAQGGDGGMEYPMMTLIRGNRSKGSLIGVTAHEAIHSWYQHLLATDEAQYPWMDEGFTSYAEDVVLQNILPKFRPYVNSYRSYFALVKSGKQEPLTTHADHYNTNRAYGTASYSMGLIFLRQLGYIVGEEVLHRSLKRYYYEWRYQHPTPNDFLRIVEKESNMELDWYMENWIETTNTIDYAIQSVSQNGDMVKVVLVNKSNFPMPVDLEVKTDSGETEFYTIPLRIMRGEKKKEGKKEYQVLKDWPWVYNAYEFEFKGQLDEISSIVIDKEGRTADVNRTNNVYPNQQLKIFNGK